MWNIFFNNNTSGGSRNLWTVRRGGGVVGVLAWYIFSGLEIVLMPLHTYPMLLYWEYRIIYIFLLTLHVITIKFMHVMLSKFSKKNKPWQNLKWGARSVHRRWIRLWIHNWSLGNWENLEEVECHLFFFSFFIYSHLFNVSDVMNLCWFPSCFPVAIEASAGSHGCPQSRAWQYGQQSQLQCHHVPQETQKSGQYHQTM